MKKIFIISSIVVLIIASLACSSSAEVIQPPTEGDSTVRTGGETYVLPTFANPDLEAKYYACVEKSKYEAPIILNIELPQNASGMQAAELWNCGNGDMYQAGGLLFPALTLTSVTPGPDEVVILGYMLVVGVGLFVIVVGMAYYEQYSVSYSTSVASPAIEPWVNTLAPTLVENSFMSRNHEESERLIAYLYTNTDTDKKVKNKGDHNSNGTIEIYGGIQGSKAAIAFVMIINTSMHIVIIQGDVLDAGFNLIPGGAIDLGGGKYIFSESTSIIASWTMTKTIGHELKTPDQFLSVGQGWEYWAVMQAKYNLYTRLAEVRLP